MMTDLLITVLALGLLFAGLRRTAGVYRRFHGKRVIACPGTGQAAAVQVAAGRAAVSSVIGKPVLQLRECSRWSERPDCGQACLRQIEAAPEDCLIRTILTKWHRGKSCVWCGRPLGDINWTLHKPSVLSPELRLFEWRDIQPETIPRVLETCSPVCWTCHSAETHTS